MRMYAEQWRRCLVRPMVQVSFRARTQREFRRTDKPGLHELHDSKRPGLRPHGRVEPKAIGANMSLRRILFLIVLIASPLMVSDARMASAFDRPIRCPFYAPTGQMVPCREYWPYVRAHEGQVQSAQGHWGCRAINGRVGGR